MKFILTILTICQLFFSFSQKNILISNNEPYYTDNNFNYYPDRIEFFFSNNQSFYKNNKIKSITNTKYLAVNKGSFTTEKYLINENGLITANLSINKDGKTIKKINYFYNETGKLKQIASKNQKDEQTTITYTYNDSNKVTSIVYKNVSLNKTIKSTHYNYTEDGKFIYRKEIDEKGNYYAQIFNYNSDGKIESKQIFKKDSIEPFVTLKYVYYPDGSTETISYLKKGKEKYKWNYNCKPEGELVASTTKNNATFCIRDEYESNGNRIVWSTKLDERGVLQKVKETYSPDALLLSKQFINHITNNVYFETIYKPEGGHKSIHYNGDGTAEIWSESFLNKEHKLTKRVDYKQNNITFYYYDMGFKVSTISISKYGTNVTEIKYEFY